jgi:aspartate/glutamate racemase
MRTLAMIHTVSWYNKSVIEPFATRWLEENPDVRAINLMDDSLLAESLEHSGPTDAVIERMEHYVQAAVLTGADVIMSSCTTMGIATERARKRCPVPLFNIDEPMAAEAVRLGARLGILATVPTSAPATRRLLEREASALGKAIQIETVINEPAFAALLAGNRAEHNRIVHAEMDRLADRVDVIVLGQISLAQIQHRPPGVTVLQVGHSGFAHARELLSRVPAAATEAMPKAIAAC